MSMKPEKNPDSATLQTMEEGANKVPNFFMAVFGFAGGVLLGEPYRSLGRANRNSPIRNCMVKWMKSLKSLRAVSVLPLVLALILIQVVSALSLGIEPIKAAAAQTIVVPDNYPTISAAIGNASAGDTILIKNGEYQENPIVNKPLTIISEEANGAVVIGSGGIERGAEPVFTLAADGITLSGFRIQSLNYSSATYYATGVNIAGDNCTLTGNNIVGTYYGVFCSVQFFTTITSNNITATLKDAIRICGGSRNTISGNLITGNAVSGIAVDGYSDTISWNNIRGNGRGIGLGASYSVVFGNNLIENSESSIYFGASDSIVASNNFTQSKWGIYFTSNFAAPNNNTVYDNNFVDNTVPVGSSSDYNVQFWDNGSEGNFWSSNNVTDSNTPFTAYAGNIDSHRLIAPYVLAQDTVVPALPATPEPVNGTAGLWHFDEVFPNGATPDAVGNNPVILESSTSTTFTPLLVDGKQGNALRFNGTDYAYLQPSPTLDIQGEVTIDAWVNIQEYKNVTYNNIAVECMRTPDKYPTRIMGFAINGEQPQNSSSQPLGALRGFFLDDSSVFNEIATTESVVPLNQWVHVVFVRSLSNGMHIYVNGQEKNVEVTSGSQNPKGQIARGTEFYIGHDSISTIDELTISTTAKESNSQPIWTEWWFWTEIIAGFTFLIVIAFYLKKSRKP